MRIKSLKINAILNALRTILGILFPLITFPYISRVLNVEGIGNINFSTSIVNYFILIAGLGIATYGIREGSKYREDDNRIENFISEVFSINILSTLFSYVLLFIILIVFDNLHKYALIILILSIQIGFTTLGVGWVCNVYEDFLFITIRSIIVQIISLFATFIFVRNINDLLIYAIILTIANSGANILNYFYIKKKYCNFSFVLNSNLKKHIIPILTIFSISIAMNIYVSADTTILGILKSDYEVGIYSCSVKVYTIVKNIIASVLLVLIPRFSILFKDSEMKYEREKLFNNILNILSMLVIPASVGLLVLSKDIILLISGPNYLSAVPSLQILCIAVTFSLFAYLFTQCILLPVMQEKLIFISTTISAIINIVLNIILIPMFGVNAAAFTTAIAEFVMVMFTMIYSRNYVKFKLCNKNIFDIFCGSVSIILVCMIIFSLNLNLYQEIFSSILFSAFTYVATLFLVGNTIIREWMGMLIKKVKKINGFKSDDKYEK